MTVVECLPSRPCFLDGCPDCVDVRERRNGQSVNGREPPTAGLRPWLSSADEMRALPRPTYIVDGWLTRDSLGVLFGASGSAKSFLALDIALCVATGSWWHDRNVERAPVVYVAAEGAGGIGTRLDAWATHGRLEHLDDHGSLSFVRRAVNLCALAEVGDLCALVAETKPGLVVVDTLARCMAGYDENSAKDMGTAVAALDRVRAVCGSCVLAVHHSGHSEPGRGRGHSSLKAALDIELQMVGTSNPRTLTATKVKDGPTPEPRSFTLTPVDTTGSCVLVPLDAAAGTSGTLAAVLAVIRTCAPPSGLTMPKLVELCAESSTLVDGSSQTPVGRTSVYRHAKTLLERGVIANVGTSKVDRYVYADQGQRDDAT